MHTCAKSLTAGFEDLLSRLYAVTMTICILGSIFVTSGDTMKRSILNNNGELR